MNPPCTFPLLRVAWKIASTNCWNHSLPSPPTFLCVWPWNQTQGNNCCKNLSMHRTDEHIMLQFCFVVFRWSYCFKASRGSFILISICFERSILWWNYSDGNCLHYNVHYRKRTNIVQARWLWSDEIEKKILFIKWSFIDQCVLKSWSWENL